MSQSTANPARLNVRLPGELKSLIERAAAQLGQTVTDFTVSTLARSAREVLQDQQVTRLSERDWKLFTALLDDSDARPNKALTRAAKRYRRQMG